jgi:hypothetical protein
MFAIESGIAGKGVRMVLPVVEGSMAARRLGADGYIGNISEQDAYSCECMALTIGLELYRTEGQARRWRDASAVCAPNGGDEQTGLDSPT